MAPNPPNDLDHFTARLGRRTASPRTATRRGEAVALLDSLAARSSEGTTCAVLAAMRPAAVRMNLRTLTTSLSGLTMGSAGRLASLQVGGAELRDVPVVLHDPGPGIDGILGNTVLARYRVTVDGDRRLLHLASR